MNLIERMRKAASDKADLRSCRYRGPIKEVVREPSCCGKFRQRNLYACLLHGKDVWDADCLKCLESKMEG